MPRKKVTKAQGDKLFAETKQRQRLLQEARTSERLEQLDIQACEELEYLELSGELECPKTDTIIQRGVISSEALNLLHDVAEVIFESSVEKSVEE